MTPIVTTSLTAALAPSIDTVSVVACRSARSRLTAPTTVTVAGVTSTAPATNPGAGVPSIAGTTGTSAWPDRSISSATVAGITCATSTPYGART